MSHLDKRRRLYILRHKHNIFQLYTWIIKQDSVSGCQSSYQLVFNTHTTFSVRHLPQCLEEYPHPCWFYY